MGFRTCFENRDLLGDGEESRKTLVKEPRERWSHCVSVPQPSFQSRHVPCDFEASPIKKWNPFSGPCILSWALCLVLASVTDKMLERHLGD